MSLIEIILELDHQIDGINKLSADFRTGYFEIKQRNSYERSDLVDFERELLNLRIEEYSDSLKFINRKLKKIWFNRGYDKEMNNFKQEVFDSINSDIPELANYNRFQNTLDSINKLRGVNRILNYLKFKEQLNLNNQSETFIKLYYLKGYSLIYYFPTDVQRVNKFN